MEKMTGVLGSFCRHKRMATSRVEVQKVVLGVEAVHNTRKKGKNTWFKKYCFWACGMK